MSHHDIGIIGALGIMLLALGIFVFMRRRRAKKIKAAMNDFVVRKRPKHAIVEFYGARFEVKNYPLTADDVVGGLYSRCLFALKEGAHDALFTFHYYYSYASIQKGNTLETNSINCILEVEAGKIYRLRFDESVVERETNVKVIFEKTIICAPNNGKGIEKRIVFEEYV